MQISYAILISVHYCCICFSKYYDQLRLKQDDMDEKLNLIMANQRLRQEAEDARKKAEELQKTQQALAETVQKEMSKREQKAKVEELERLLQKQKDEFESMKEQLKKTEKVLDKKAKDLEEKNDQNVLNQRQTWQDEQKKTSGSWLDWGTSK